MQDLSSILSGVLGILLIFNGAVFIHEWGHFLVAKWRGLKVDRFSLFGLGPALLKWQGKDGVTYCICALPFGAFVSIPQMSNPASLEGPAAERFGHLPVASATDKILVAFAGPLFNIVFALLLAGGVWWWGQPVQEALRTTQIGYVPQELKVSGNKRIPNPARLAGLMAGDTIERVDGQSPANFQDIIEAVALGSGRTKTGEPQVELTVRRGGKTFEVEVVPALVHFNPKSSATLRKIGVLPAQTLRVARVFQGSPASQAGLHAGDRLVSVNDQAIYHLRQIRDQLRNGGGTFRFKVERAGQTLTFNIAPVLRPTTKYLLEVLEPEGGKPALELVPDYPPKAALADFTQAEAACDFLLFKRSKGALKGLPESSAVLRSINGVRPKSFQQLLDETGKAGPWELVWEKEGKMGRTLLPSEASFREVPPVLTPWIGIQHSGELVLVHPAPPAQIRDVFTRTFRTLGSLLNPQSDIGLSQLSGPLGIGRLVYRLSSSETYAWQFALAFAVFLNINLAVLNLLPIPVLDGGHIVAATLEKVLGRKIPESWLARLQGLFALLFLFLMIYVLFHDTVRWSGDHSLQAERARLESHLVPLPRP